VKKIFAETSTCTSSQTLCKSRSSYFWNHSSDFDTLKIAMPHKSGAPFVGERVFQDWGVWGQAFPSFPSPIPLLPPFSLSPHFSSGPNAKNSFARPEFRSRRSGTLATQASRMCDGTTCQLVHCLLSALLLGMTLSDFALSVKGKRRMCVQLSSIIVVHRICDFYLEPIKARHVAQLMSF